MTAVTRISADLIIHHASTLLTLAGASRPRRGTEMDDLSPIEQGAVAIRDGRILATGTTRDIIAAYTAEQQIDAQGCLVMPGFVDSHTHLVYAGSREQEMARKINGESYLQILQSGGGIHSTVRAVREADENQLLHTALKRLDRLLAHGTTTVEIKTGYGLSAKDELKMLTVIQRLQQRHSLDIIATFLGAHVAPLDQPREDYLRWLSNQALHLAKPTARFFDVFCESEAFTLAETEMLLLAARSAGFRLKVHAGQFHALGAAGLAARLGAVSVDHCDHLAADEIKAMAQAGTIAVLLPGAAFFGGHGAYADAQRLIREGVPVALATDFNPGSCPSYSMLMMIALACLQMKMTPAQAITAATVNGAHALDREDIGSLEPDKQADVIILDVQSPQQIPYHFGVNLINRVIKKGHVVFDQNAALEFQ
ncbi:MAG: imidazolonepropionase [Calditrichaeota bacterium]|nr:MAG: imidazolonepropionase [Calditrichota bacterium]